MPSEMANVKSATSTTLNTIELLEAIILRLPCKDVLLLQRVSKTWQAVIKRNFKLQRALGFVSIRDGGKALLSNPTDQQTTNIGPRGPRSFTTWRTPVLSSSVSAYDFYNNTTAHDGFVFNPLIKVFLSKGYCRYFNCERTAVSSRVAGYASSRKLFLTHPPSSELRIRYFQTFAEKVSLRDNRVRLGRYCYYGDGMYFDCQVHHYMNYNGVTINDLVELVKKAIKDDDGDSYQFEIEMK